MTDTTIARRYASALFESIGDVASSEQVRGQLSTLAAATGQAEFRQFVENPRVPLEKKQAVLAALATKAGAEQKAANLIALLAENDRIGDLDAVAEAFGDLVDQAAGRVAVTVTAAITLPGEVMQKVDSKLTGILGGDADIRHTVDERIIGGLVIQIGSRIFDYSIRHQLARLRQTL